MSTPTPPPTRSRWRRRARIVLALVVVLAGWQAWVHTTAWNNLKAGRDALERGDPAGARPLLDRCLESWPNSAEAHFLAARAARRCGDHNAAKTHLRTAAQLGRAPDEIEVEEILIQAQFAYLPDVEPALRWYVTEGHPQSAEMIALLVPAYMAEFRIGDAGTLAAKWVELVPDSVPAWTYRADVLERLRRKEDAVTALRRLVELAPNDRRARTSLVRMLYETRLAPDEAAGHAEWLTTTDPADPAAQVQLGACREAQGRLDEAVAILDRVIAGSRDPQALHYFQALHYRGRLEMNRGRPAEALPFLRRAADRPQAEVDLLYTIFLCTKQAGTPAEAQAAEERWRRSDADSKRVAELAKAISKAPQNPDLRHEMGELFLRYGRDTDGVRWLESALRVRPDHAPTHRALAAYYERTGRPDLAREHAAPAAPKVP